MTLKEAINAARECVPIVHDGIRYVCISSVGWHFFSGKPSQFVELRDKNGRGVVIADPSRVELYRRCCFCGDEITGKGVSAEPLADGACCPKCFIKVLEERKRRHISEMQ